MVCMICICIAMCILTEASQSFKHLFFKMIPAILCLGLFAYGTVASAADISDAPYQVSLQMRRNHFCGGSILSSEWILTSAQCVQGKYGPNIEVVAGTSSLYPEDPGFQRRKVEDVIKHPNSGASSAEKRIFYNDVALLRLEKPLTLGGNVQAIQLDDKLSEPDNFIVSGFGVEVDGELEADALQIKSMPAISGADCKKSWAVYYSPDMYGFLAPPTYSPVIEDWFVCGQFEKLRWCKGEDKLNGGPVVSTNTKKQIGVVTLGNACGKLERPSVFTSLESSLREWIKEKTGLSV